MRVGEYGLVFYQDARLDISGFTAFTLVFTKPDNTSFTRTDPDVAVGDADISTPFGTFLANQYATYTFQDGDIDLFGEWHAQLTVNDGNRNLISSSASFTVLE